MTGPAVARRWRGPGLRLRLTLGAGLLAALAALAAGGAALGLARAERWHAEADAAQAQVDGYGALSGRITARLVARTEDAATAMAAVEAGFDVLQAQAAAGARAAATPALAAERGRQGRDLARLRGLTRQLDAGLLAAGSDPAARAAQVNAFAAAFSPVVNGQIETARARHATARAAAARWSDRIRGLAVGTAAAAALALAGMLAGVVRPLVRRIATATAAPTAGPAGLRLDAGRHDELGLLFARINRATARLDRRAARIAADRADLGRLVRERTAQLTVATTRLARIDEDRRRLFADIGHELRTPLTVILAETELARTDDPAIAAALATIRARAERLNRRVDDMLRVARSDNGTLDLDRRAVDLGALADAALADAAPLLRRAGIAPERVAEAPAPAIGDADWLRQIIAGLIENAAKYAGRGARVTVLTGRDGDGVFATVRDDGPGLPDAARAAATGRFVRGPGSPPSSGFGVGLALAVWVAEGHDGRLDLAPGESGHGLSATLRLPARAVAPVEAAA